MIRSTESKTECSIVESIQYNTVIRLTESRTTTESEIIRNTLRSIDDGGVRDCFSNAKSMIR